MTNQELETYFEDLATRFKPVGHTKANPRYCRFDIDEVVTGLRHQLDLLNFCLLLEAPAGSYEDNGADGYFDNQQIAFMLIRTVEVRDFAGERETISKSRELGKSLVGKILEESLFADIDENGIEYEKVGPLFGAVNAYGYRFSLTVIDAVAIVANPADWI